MSINTSGTTILESYTDRLQSVLQYTENATLELQRILHDTETCKLSAVQHEFVSQNINTLLDTAAGIRKHCKIMS